MCCGFHFYRSRRYEVLYQGSIPAVLIMSVLRRRTEFYKGESDREVIVIAAGEGAESLLQQAGFPIMEALPSHQFFSLPHESLSSHYCYLKRDTKWINSQRDVQKIFCLWSVFLWEFAIQKLLISSPQQNFQGNVTNLLNKSKWKTMAGPRKSLGLVSRTKTQFFWLFNAFKAIKWVTMALKTMA